MQNYYRVLGVGPTATAQEIEQAYLRQRTRLKRLAAHDPAMKSRLADVEDGYGILTHPRRRLAYDVLLAEEPEAPARPARRPDERMGRYARVARSLNAALLAGCLLLGLDWGLPPRQYAHETVLSRFPVSVFSSSLSDPQMAYRVHTEHTTFRLPSALSHRVQPGQPLIVWQTPLLGVVQRISEPRSPDGAAPFQPYGGTIYGSFFLLPLLIVAVAVVGLWPGRTPEMVVNTAAVGGLLTILVLVVILSF